MPDDRLPRHPPRVGGYYAPRRRASRWWVPAFVMAAILLPMLLLFVGYALGGDGTAIGDSL